MSTAAQLYMTLHRLATAAEARETAEQVFRELDDMKKHINDDEDVRRVNEARSELRRKLNRSEEALRTAPETVEDKSSSRPVKPGDVVLIKSMNIKATVISVSPDRILSLKAGIMNVSAKEDEVLLLEGEKAPERKSAPMKGGASIRAAVPTEIDLRGMESLEAVAAAEQYLDSAVMAKLGTVTIIHGKGTGALRAAIQQMLKRNKLVKSFRPGRFGEGEMGVTVVELK